MHKIVKYQNRKLYSKTKKGYVTLEEIPAMDSVIITCNETGNDITGQVLFDAASKKLKKRNMQLDGAILLNTLLNETRLGDR